MTRGLNPPDNLSVENVTTLRSVRRDVYYHGMLGGGVGLCSGIVLYTGAQWAKKLGIVKGKGMNRNTGLLTILSSFAMGTFFAASATGKELAHMLHPIFQEANNNSLLLQDNNNHDGNDLLSSPTRRINYQTKILLASNNDTSKKEEGTNNHNDSNNIVVDRQQLHEMRVTRRKSLMENLHQRGHGLSDSHSGRWVEENSETIFEKE